MTDIIVLALAVWRISYMIINENGPYDMFPRFHAFLGIQYDPVTDSPELPEGLHRNAIAELFICIYCLSVWVGFLFAALYYFYPVAAFYIALPFAFSALSITWEKIFNG